jgi:hypothetical protein
MFSKNFKLYNLILNNKNKQPDKLADDKKMEPSKKHLIEKLIDHSKNVADTVECQLCTYLVSQADTLLKQNKTEQLIVDELSRICNLFSNDVKPQVIYLMDNFCYQKYAVNKLIKIFFLIY